MLRTCTIGLSAALLTLQACGDDSRPVGFSTGSASSKPRNAEPNTPARGPSESFPDSPAGGGAQAEDDNQGPYPIVLAHGFFGFEELGHLSFTQYFYGIPQDLATVGETEVFTPEIDPFNTSEERGKQLIAAIESIVEQTGKHKVNLIGHSQGGLDARVVAHDRPDLVASVTGLGAPNRGTPVGEWLEGPASSEPLVALADLFVRVGGSLLWDKITDASNLEGPARLFSQEGIAEFNAKYTDRPEVAYYSIAGRSRDQQGGDECIPDLATSLVSVWGSTVDPVDALFALQAKMMAGDENLVGDGLVLVNDAKWGTFLGCIPADHLDQVGQVLGDDPGSAFDHRRFFRDMVGFLRSEGF